MQRSSWFKLDEAEHMLRLKCSRWKTISSITKHCDKLLDKSGPSKHISIDISAQQYEEQVGEDLHLKSTNLGINPFPKYAMASS